MKETRQPSEVPTRDEITFLSERLKYVAGFLNVDDKTLEAIAIVRACLDENVKLFPYAQNGNNLPAVINKHELRLTENIKLLGLEKSVVGKNWQISHPEFNSKLGYFDQGKPVYIKSGKEIIIRLRKSNYNSEPDLHEKQTGITIENASDASSNNKFLFKVWKSECFGRRKLIGQYYARNESTKEIEASVIEFYYIDKDPFILDTYLFRFSPTADKDIIEMKEMRNYR